MKPVWIILGKRLAAGLSSVVLQYRAMREYAARRGPSPTAPHPAKSLFVRLRISGVLSHDLNLVQRIVAIVDRCHDLVAGFHLVEDGGIINFIIHSHGPHPTLNLLAIHREAFVALVHRFYFA